MLRNARDRQKCQKLSLISHVHSLVYNFHRDKKEKTVTNEGCNTHILYHLVKDVFRKIINNRY